MNRILNILQLLLRLWHNLFPTKQKLVNTKDENIQTMKAALDSVDQTNDVILAQKKIAYIETLSEKEREEKEEEILEVQEVVEKKASAKPITEKRAKGLIEKYKKRRME